MKDHAKYSRTDLDPEELAETRWANERTGEMWRLLGPLVQVSRGWKFWVSVAGVFAWINWDTVAAMAAVLKGAGQ